MIAASKAPRLFADELERMLAATPADAAVTLSLRRGGKEYATTMRGVPICGARVIYKLNDGLDAYADSESGNLAITSGMIAFNGRDDALAMVIAHELAHIINRDGKAGGVSQRRDMEDAADMAGAGLVQCAGYDLTAATRFYADYNKHDWLRWIRDPTHRSMKSRARRVLGAPRDIACPLDQAELKKLSAID